MGVACELEIQRLPDDTIELYFRHNRKVNFLQTASSGTLALFDMYRMLQTFQCITFMYLDEFDAFYHYEMSENMIAFLKGKYPDSQIVMTTHNTNLMTNHAAGLLIHFVCLWNAYTSLRCDKSGTQRGA